MGVTDTINGILAYQNNPVTKGLPTMEEATAAMQLLDDTLEVTNDQARHAVKTLMRFLGEDIEREGLIETPERVIRAMKVWYSGYKVKDSDLSSLLKVFEDGSEGCDGMVVVRELPFYSHCEHHMVPIFGTATIGYLPDKHIVGLSKLSRLLDVFARRMQVQERLTTQVADALMTHLQPLGCGIIVTARHLCMESRGIEKQGHATQTSALRGVFKTKPEVRAEFLSLRNSGPGGVL